MLYQRWGNIRFKILDLRTGRVFLIALILVKNLCIGTLFLQVLVHISLWLVDLS